ncbi:hypothetical protein E0L36_21140 [Streptomyces sp. AJS327]|uniref:hypothetical protein n=1 Tax=Streptomyces sp. AJS327 TaxID=2545265 RepID=UPI0015DFA7E4|nr:hypothetical protein [Streptomyces sp. AJS327]MBA0053287.1 hypothetical protein [Streptomyces sp. AJS327]
MSETGEPRAEPVLETAYRTVFDGWPTAEPAPDGLLVLSGELTSDEVGLALAVLVDYNQCDPDGPDDRGSESDPAMNLPNLAPAPDPDPASDLVPGLNPASTPDPVPGSEGEAALRRLGQLTRVEHLLIPGGLRLRDPATGRTITPGCCSGLEDWPEWTELFDGEVPWLGHDPTPQVELRGTTAYFWPDARRTPSTGDGDADRADRRPTPTDGFPSSTADAGPRDPEQSLDTALVVDADCLERLLTEVREDLHGFVAAVERWALRYAPTHLTALRESLTDGLALSDDVPSGRTG